MRNESEQVETVSFRNVHCSKRIRFIQAILFTTITLSCFYFFTGGGWNQASHFDLVRALCESGSVQIDSYHSNTGDLSYFDGHYYCNKGPGMAILAVPGVAFTQLIARTVGADLHSETTLLCEYRVATFVCSILPTALAGLALFAIALRLGASLSAASFGTVAFGLTTPAWVYGTFFWAHALVTCCLLVAFASGLALSESDSKRRDVTLGLIIGATLGWAVLSEVQSCGACILVAAFGLGCVWNGGRQRALRVIGSITIGSLSPVLLLLVYNAAAFGSPFRLSYASVIGFPGQNEGVFGVTYPKVSVIAKLLVGPQRGLLHYAPILASAPIGFGVLANQTRTRRIMMVACGVFVYYLLLNSSFYYWKAGWCYGPRYMAPGIAFLCISLPLAWDRLRRRGRILLSILGAASLLSTLASIATYPMTPEDLSWPHLDLLWPAFLDGRLSLNQGQLFSAAPTPSFNLGEWCGLRGLPSLLPLVMLWILLLGIGAWVVPKVSNEPASGGLKADIGTS